MANSIPATPATPPDVAERIALRTLSRRGADYAGEVRRLLDAGLEVLRACGTSARPRVADIVAEAGLSNDAFYRHFPSKDALVAALLEDGTDRLISYVTHQMEKEPTPQGKVRRWVEGVLSQAADDAVAATTLAVMWNAGGVSRASTSGPPSAVAPLAALVHEPFAALGCPDPPLSASLAAHALLGTLGDHLWRRASPTPAEVEHVVAACLGIATAVAGS